MKIITILTLSLLLSSCKTHTGIEGSWQIDNDTYFIITLDKLTIFTAERKPLTLIETEVCYTVKVENDRLICTNPKSYSKSYNINRGEVDRSSYGGGKIVNLDKERIFTYIKDDKTLVLKSPEGTIIKAKRKDM